MSDDQKRLADALEELKDHNFMKIHESSIKFIYYNLLTRACDRIRLSSWRHIAGFNPGSNSCSD